jgi:hypothetical protein
MRNLLAVLGVPTAILFSLATLGCGASSTPVGTVNATTHPLVAQYAIQHSRSGLTAWVEFGTDTNYGRKTSVAANSGMTRGRQTLTILVAGMKAQTTYHMRAHADWSGGSWVDQDKTFTTGALPSALPAPTITVTQPDSNATPAPGVELLSLIQPFGTQMLQSVCTDLQGNIIWYYPEGGVPIKLMQNGHFILNLNTDLREIDLAGNTIRDVSATQVNQSLQANGYSFSINGASFSHDVLTLDNGHWIGLVKVTKDFTDLPGYPGTITILGDGLVDIDPNGNVVWAWSAFDYLDVNRFLQGLPDWTHANSLLYTPDGNLMLSVRNQSWILKIDYANGAGSGNILWKLGNDGDFAINGGDPAQWFYAEHDPVLLSTEGTLSTVGVWDNGNYRINSAGIPCESSPTAPACYSRPVIFQLDEVTKVATVLWQDLPGTYSPWGGSIGTLSNGNVEFDITSPLNAPFSHIVETTQTETPAIVWQMTVTGENAYRGSRIPSLYPGVTWQQ